MQTLELIQHHHGELVKWLARAEETGLFIARDAWDALESVVEDYSQDGIYWEFTSNMPCSWALQLGMAFDESCAQWIENRLHALDESMGESMGERWCFDVNRATLDSLRQSLRIGNQFETRLAKLLKQARPGLLEVTRRMLLDNADYVLNHMENDSIKDGFRLRQQFYDARQDIVPQLASVATELLQRSVQHYQIALAQATTAIG